MSDFTKIKDKKKSEQGQHRSPTVSAKGNSVVTIKDITGVRAKNLNCRIETGSDPGSSQSGSAGGQDPHTALIKYLMSLLTAISISPCPEKRPKLQSLCPNINTRLST